jgi:hypothetical protein
MNPTLESKTFSLKLNASANDVYFFVSNPENLPKWATTFCKSIKRDGSDWVIETNEGFVRVKYVEKNNLGVLDHFIYLTPDVEVYVPMRVVRNHEGSEMLFTLFKLPFMDDERFKLDCKLVEQDLTTLKIVMESTVPSR